LASYTLENCDLAVRIDRRGAELRSLFDKTAQRELIWRADPSVWAASAPILFPAVGRLKGGGYLHRGRHYPLPIHGFAAQRDFSLVAQDASALTFALRADADTRAVYPFDFNLQVRFTLEAAALRVDYRVANCGAEPMPFSLGSHPAFALPGDSMAEADSYLEFEAAEAPQCHRIRNGLLGASAEALDFDGQRLPLRADTFADDALIFRQLRSRRLHLFARGERLLCFETGGLPHLGLWAKPNAPYVCLEPWLTSDDQPSAPLALAQKPGFITLAAGEDFACGYRICV